MPSYAGYLPTSRSETGHSSSEHISKFPKYSLSVEFNLDFSFSSKFLSYASVHMWNATE